MMLVNGRVKVGSCRMFLLVPRARRWGRTGNRDISAGRKVVEKEDFWSQQVQHHTTGKHFLGTCCGRELGCLLYRHSLTESP